MKKYLAMLAAVQTLLSGSAPPSYPSRLQVQEGSEHPLVAKSEQEGIKDLHQLVLEADTEDAWAYVPEFREWHDVGDESFFIPGTTVGLRLDRVKIEELSEDNSQIVLYHIHPKPAVQKLLKSYLENPSDERLTPEQLVESFLIDSTTPSVEDLTSAVYFSCKFGKDSENRYRIASIYGITTYYLQPQSIDEICKGEENPPFQLGAQILARRFLDSFKHKHIERRVHRALRQKKEVILLNDKNFTVTFRPYSAIK